jgi:hypothetical protein
MTDCGAVAPCLAQEEPRVHGHSHAGVRIAREGTTLIPAQDALAQHPDPFGVADLYPYRSVEPRACKHGAVSGCRIMCLA